MGAEQSSTMNGAQGSSKSCRPCGEWGQKELATVKVDAAAIQARGKENTAHPNITTPAAAKANTPSKEDQEAQEKAKQRLELERQQEARRREEEERKEMERKVREEQERQQAELKRREAEQQRLQLEQEAREREEQEKQRQEREEQARRELENLELQQKQKEKEFEDQQKINAWLKANGFKGINELTRKKLSKVAPLQCAIQSNDIEMVKLLLQNGADASKVNGKNESALTVAKKADKKDSHAAVIEVLTTYAK